MKKISLRKINLFLTFIVLALFVNLQSGINPTEAGGPIFICDSGTALTWGNGGVGIPFNPDQGGLGPLTNAEAVAAVREAFDVWEAVPTSTASYTNAGELPFDVDETNFGPLIQPNLQDGLNPVIFDENGEIFSALGFGELTPALLRLEGDINCELNRVTVIFNGRFFEIASDLAPDVLAQVAGTYSGVGDTIVNTQIYRDNDQSGPTPNNTFTPVPDPFTNDVIETMTRGINILLPLMQETLHKDDMASLSTLYPTADFASTTGTISGTIFAPNGTTKLTGVNVIARNVADPFNDAISAVSGDFAVSGDEQDPRAGTYTIEGLTPGASYAIYVDEILTPGGINSQRLSPLPGPEEFYNGVNESNNITSPDDPSDFTPVSVPAGSHVTGVDIIFNTPAPGDPLPVSNNGHFEISLPFTFKGCGVEVDSFFVNENGTLTAVIPEFFIFFGGESISQMLKDDRPRIAGLWDDLDSTTPGASVYYTLGNDTITFHWENVSSETGPNTFSITLKKSSDHIDMKYGDISATGGISGVSCGGRFTSNFEPPVDLTGFGERRINLHNQPAVYELWNSSNPNDISNKTIRFNGTTNYNDSWAEPNDTIDKARNVSLPFNSIPVTRYTEIQPIGSDVDHYSFDLEAGKVLVAQIKNGNIDSLMGLYDPNGNLVAVDDDSGVLFLSRIVHPVTTGGKYTLAVSSYPGFDVGSRYVLDIHQANDNFALDLGLFSSTEVDLGFTFPFQGNNYTSVFVDSHGNLTFGSGANFPMVGTVPNLLNNQPRIAALWTLLDQRRGGLVTAELNDGSATITFDSVPQWLSLPYLNNTFSVTLDSDGTIVVDYGALAFPLDSYPTMVGVTEGGGAADPGGTDLSASPDRSATGTTYELFFSPDEMDLSFKKITYRP